MTDSAYPPAIYAGIDRLVQQARRADRAYWTRIHERDAAEADRYRKKQEADRRAAQNDRLAKLRERE